MLAVKNRLFVGTSFAREGKKIIMKNYKIQLFFIAFLLVNFTNAQSRRIEIGGYGEMKVTPDQGILYISIDALEMQFGEAVTSLGKKEKHILKLIASLDYEKEIVKTTHFSVRENTIWRNGTRYDSGFIASQSMSFEFPNTKEQIAKIINGFSDKKTDAQINFSFKLSDELKDKLNAQVLKLAVDDAKMNAELLAKYSGVSIKSILKINYQASNELISHSSGVRQMEAYGSLDIKSAGNSTGFQAEEITLSDRVTIFFEIE